MQKALQSSAAVDPLEALPKKNMNKSKFSTHRPSTFWCKFRISLQIPHQSPFAFKKATNSSEVKAPYWKSYPSDPELRGWPACWLLSSEHARKHSPLLFLMFFPSTYPGTEKETLKIGSSAKAWWVSSQSPICPQSEWGKKLKTMKTCLIIIPISTL